MEFVELFLLAVGLSMDAFAVSVCKGLFMKRATVRAQLTCGVWFGGFQALMTLIGYFLGTLFIDAIQTFDHWIAFALLALFLVQQMDGMVISPRVMGNITGFSPAVVLLALFAGARLCSIRGMLLALPTLMAVRTLYRVFVQRRENN